MTTTFTTGMLDVCADTNQITPSYSSIENTDLSILFAVALPYGIYDNVYHKLADTEQGRPEDKC